MSVRKTVNVDSELIKALGEDDAALSATVNELLRREVERRRNPVALGQLLARLDEERGPVDAGEVARFRRLLR